MSFLALHTETRSSCLLHMDMQALCTGSVTSSINLCRNPLGCRRDIRAKPLRASRANNGVSKSAFDTMEASTSSDTRADLSSVAVLDQDSRPHQHILSNASSPEAGPAHMATLVSWLDKPEDETVWSHAY